MQVRFYDDRGNRLETRELEATPKLGDVFHIPVVGEGVLKLVVTEVHKPDQVMVEAPDMSN